MTNTKFTKRALISSVLALFLCFAMLLGTTYAWFTDSVTSDGNIIQTGTLDVAMYWAEGDEDPTAVSEWKDASKGALFNNNKWEPGYSEAKHIKIANEGTLALKYQMRILANGVVSELANVIDVYYFDEAKQLTNADFVDANRLGTLAEVLNVTYDKNISKAVSGSLAEQTYKTVTLAFKMQESAGDEYQEMSIGADFSIQILATQDTLEKNGLEDDKYDADADFAPQDVPVAMVYALPKSKLQTITIGGFNGATLDTGYSFQPTETYEQASASEYEWAHADFFVYADATVPANSMALAGFYKAFSGFQWPSGSGNVCSETNWIGLTADVDIAAGVENGIRLLGDGMGMLGISYSEICNMGNDGTGFLCGAADLTGANEGTTLYVELRVYKTECDVPGCNHNNSCETGEYITIGKFEYTFGGNYITLDDGSEIFMADDGDIWLSNVANVTADEYYVPDGITVLEGGVFATNSNVKTVVISDTITDFGATGVSATGASGGAFKGSSVEKVVLPEGMTEIPAAAFNGAKSLVEVEIPSTVETIGVNAFRQTAIEELTVPATIENISCGAFRDMTALTTVTVEGDVNFENYAFRSVPNLTSIYLLGDDVTFSGSQFATRSDNGDATGITIYVKNATVAARVYAAQTSAYGYEVKVLGNEADGSDADEVVKVTNATSLGDAINNGTGTIVLDAVEMKMPSSSTNADITIAGTKNTVLDVTKGAYMDGANVTIEGVTIKTSTGYVMDENGNQGSDYAALYSPNTTYVNCTFVGPMRVGRDGAKFINCTFTELGNDYVWTYGNDVTFEGCTFNTDGKAILIYSDGGNEVSKVTVKKCTFNSTAGAKAGAIANQNCAAIEIHNYGNGVNLTTEGNTYDSNFSGEWRIKTYETGKPQIIVNGTEYTTIAIDGKTMTIDADKKVTVQ